VGRDIRHTRGALPHHHTSKGKTMKHLSRRPLLLGAAVTASVVVAVAVGAGIGAAAGVASAEPDPAPSATAETSFPDLAAATRETPSLASLAAADPAAGTVAQASGPFDDRFVLHDLALGDAEVSGSVEITSDVSEVLELEVVAGFYNADGVLLGENAFVLHADEEEHSHAGEPEESHAFTVPVPDALAGEVASAAVGVSVLVNE
jgi:hypothetical protein